MALRLPFRAFAGALAVALAVPLVAAGCGDGSPFRPDPEAEPPGLLLPIEGQVNQDFFVVSYMDVSAVPHATLDYACGVKTWEGHDGVDFTLRSFAHMDEGVGVRAAARGVVEHVRDGLFDRNRTREAGGGLGNHVILRHDGGIETVYAHLRSGSIRVSEGDVVSPGAPLGEVGSSGASDHPHLHFEVRKDGLAVEPFQGLCGPGRTLWDDPLPYQDQFLLIDAGVTDQALDLDAVRDPPPETSRFIAGQDRMWAWVQLANVPSGSIGRFELVSPSGASVLTQSFLHRETFGMSWWWFWTDLEGEAAEPGTWLIRYRNGDALVAEQSYVVEAGAVPVAGAAPVTGAAPVAGGTSLPDHGVEGGGLAR